MSRSGNASGASGNPRLRVVKNTAALLFLRVAMPALSMVIVLAISRKLGSEGLGRYTLAFTFVYFFNTVAPLGLYPLITRDGARDRDGLERLLGNGFTIGTIAGAVLTVVMAGLGCVLHYDAGSRTAIILLSLFIVPWTLGVLQEAAFAALERMELIAVAALTESLFKVGVGVALLLAGAGLEAVLLVAVGGRIVACVVSALLLRRTGVRVRWGWDTDVIRSLLGIAPTFLMTQIFATLYWRVDVFLLSQMRSVDEVGLYGAAWRLLEIAIVVPQSLSLALFPQIAAALRSDPAMLSWLGRTANRYLFGASLPVAVVATVLGDRILGALYGESFQVAGSTLSLLMWSVVPYGWVKYYAYLLVAADRQRADLALNVVMTVLNIVLNLVLIPLYGYWGAGLATVLCAFAYCGAQWVYLRRTLPSHLAETGLGWAPLLGAVAAGMCAWLLRDVNVALAGASAAAAYLVVLLMGGFFTEAELRTLRLEWLLRPFGVQARAR